MLADATIPGRPPSTKTMLPRLDECSSTQTVDDHSPSPPRVRMASVSRRARPAQLRGRIPRSSANPPPTAESGIFSNSEGTMPMSSTSNDSVRRQPQPRAGLRRRAPRTTTVGRRPRSRSLPSRFRRLPNSTRHRNSGPGTNATRTTAPRRRPASSGASRTRGSRSRSAARRGPPRRRARTPAAPRNPRSRSSRPPRTRRTGNRLGQTRNAHPASAAGRARVGRGRRGRLHRRGAELELDIAVSESSLFPGASIQLYISGITPHLVNTLAEMGFGLGDIDVVTVAPSSATSSSSMAARRTSATQNAPATNTVRVTSAPVLINPAGTLNQPE